jgi:hypothetical protein
MIEEKFALRIVVEILFEARKKIETESLAEGNALTLIISLAVGNAQIIPIKILKILLKAKVSKTL